MIVQSLFSLFLSPPLFVVRTFPPFKEVPPVWRGCQFLASYFSHKTMAYLSVIGGKPERKENTASNLFSCMNREKGENRGSRGCINVQGYGTSMGYTEKLAREKRRT
ncbi:MAG: hypothetical protein JOS17DRAFT_390139 [Linnemannia elongata]|nr:MAG: hypothetical protein JOS17DRAFT_390139 [Linnemannia elongata]